jgi:hypothetical protein
MRLNGALSNPEAHGALKNLHEVVRTAAARPEPAARPKAHRGRRPGWVAPLVLKILEASASPMTATAIRKEIVQRFSERPDYESVRYVLRYGKEAQLGLIERVAAGRYGVRREYS